MLNLSTLLDSVVDLIKKVGRFIEAEYKTFDRSVVEQKGINDLVSYVDIEAEKRLIAGLKKILPKSGFIAEEGSYNENEKIKDFKWIIDPLDGTTNFVHGLPIFAISVALMEKQKIVLGVVFEINHHECFYAIDGEKAYCNGEPISISSVETLSESLIATGFPFRNFERLPAYFQILNDFMLTTHGVRRMGSAAVDLIYTACGRFEGFFEYNLNAWDVAAGAFIVQKAGGVVTDFKGGDDFIFGKEIIASGKIHHQMIDIIKKYWNTFHQLK